MENKYTLSPHKLIKVNKKNYVYIGNTGAIYSIDNEYKKNIKNFNTLNENDILNQFKKIKLVVNSDDKVSIKYFTPSIHSITIIVNEGCNLKCKYCYEKNKKFKEISLNDAIKSIEFLLEFNNSITVAFFGGEPLLSFNLIRKIVNHFINLNNKKIQYAITTNGTLINKEIAEFLIEHRFDVTISIDGTKEINDLNRVDKNGNGTYDRTMAGLSLIERLYPIVRSTIATNNLNIIDIINNFIDKKVQFVYCNPAYDNFKNQEHYSKYAKSFMGFIDEFEEQLKKGNYDFCLNSFNIISILRFLNRPFNRISYCDACLHSISVDNELDIYPCHRYSSNKQNKICNLFEQNVLKKINKTFYKSFILKDDSCLKCWAKLICGGGCIYENQNRILIKRSYCKNVRQISQRMIELYVKLSDNDKRKLFK